jgi:hypothetical protein
MSDLPRCAVNKVAFDFLEQRNAPSSEAHLSKMRRHVRLQATPDADSDRLSRLGVCIGRIPLSRRERVARERRVRAARPTMFANDEIVGRVPLIRRFRATFSRGEKDPPHRFSNYLGQHCLKGGVENPPLFRFVSKRQRCATVPNQGGGSRGGPRSFRNLRVFIALLLVQSSGRSAQRPRFLQRRPVERHR